VTERDKFILRASLIYSQSNLGDLSEAFYHSRDVLSVNGDLGEDISEEEVENLLFDLY